MQAPQRADALVLRGPAERVKGAPRRADCAPRVLLVAQRDASDHLAVGRTDDVLDLLAVRFDEPAVDLVGRNGCHGAFAASAFMAGGECAIILTDTSKSLFLSIEYRKGIKWNYDTCATSSRSGRSSTSVARRPGS